MEEIEKKFAKFKEDCFKQAEQDADNLQLKIKEQIDAQVLEELKQYNEKQEVKFEREMNKIEKDYYAQRFSLETEVKQKLIDKEKEIQEKYKLELENMIKTFINSRDYEKYLKKNIEKSLEQIQEKKDSKGIVIYLTKNDKKEYSENLKKEYPNIKIELMEEENLGGSQCYCKKKNIFIDNTLKLAVQEQVEDKRW